MEAAGAEPAGSDADLIDEINALAEGASAPSCGSGAEPAAYKASPRDIPLLAQKVEKVLSKAGFPPASHDRKALLEIVESYPRDSLFQMTSDELFEVAVCEEFVPCTVRSNFTGTDSRTRFL